MTFRSGRGPALNLPPWRGLTESPPLSLRVAKRANQGKERSEEPQEKGIAVVGGAKVRVGMIKGGARTDVTDTDTARVEAGVVRDAPETGGPAVGGARAVAEGGIVRMGGAKEVGGAIGTVTDGAAAVVAAEGP